MHITHFFLSFLQNQRWLFTVFLVLLAGLLQNTVRQIDVHSYALVPEQAQYIGLSIDPRILKRLLGIRVLAADLVWLDLLIKADIRRTAEPFTPLYRAAKTVTVLDPDQFNVYYFAGMYLSVITDDIKGATALLRDGAQHIERSKLEDHPLAWRVFFMLGYNLLFEELEVEEGSIWIKKAGNSSGAPLFVKDLARRISTEQGRLQVAARILADLYRRVTRPEERIQVEQKMLHLAVQQELVDMNEKFQTFLKHTDAVAFNREKAFKLFLHEYGIKKNMLGKPLGLDKLGKITVK